MKTIPLEVVLVALFCVWFMVEAFLLTFYQGPLKRGVPVWKEFLSPDRVAFLRSLPSEYQNSRGFIKSNGEEILVRAQDPFWRTVFPYIAYIDLRSPNPKIEYRTSLSGLLIFVPFIASTLLAPFAVFMLVFNGLMERRAINNFIQRVMWQPQSAEGSFSELSVLIAKLIVRGALLGIFILFLLEIFYINK